MGAGGHTASPLLLPPKLTTSIFCDGGGGGGSSVSTYDVKATIVKVIRSHNCAIHFFFFHKIFRVWPVVQSMTVTRDEEVK